MILSNNLLQVFKLSSKNTWQLLFMLLYSRLWQLWKIKYPSTPVFYWLWRVFPFCFETKKIVFYSPLLCFLIVLIWLFIINSKSVFKWQISCSLSVSSFLLYNGIKPCYFTYTKLKFFKVFRISSHVYLCSKAFSRYL